MTCQCGEILIKSVDGTTKIRSKIMVFRGDRAFAVCKGCGAEQSIPVRLLQEDIIDNRRIPKLFLNSKKP